MRKVFIPLALLAMMLVLGQSSAQPDPEMMKVYFAVGRITNETPGSVVRNQGVQKELKLDEDQIKAVQEKVPAIGFGFGGGGGGGFGKGKGGGGKGKGLTEEQKEKAAKYREKVEALKDTPEDKLEDKVREAFKDELETQAKEVEKILKPEQMTRLKQIARQQGGPLAYLKPENVKDLSVTDEQKTKLKAISAELDKDRQELFRSGFGAETREKMENLAKEANDKATAVLTDEQKSKWKTLVGEPYTVRFGGGRPKKDD